MSTGDPLRIATWNVNSLNARMPRVEEWLAEMAPDVVCLQETKLPDTAFPALVFQGLGYESVHHGQGQWNGVAILSRVGLEDPAFGFADGAPEDPDARIVSARCAGVRVYSVYVPNGRSLDDDHYRYKLAWLERLRGLLDAEHDPAEPVAICGDYNIAPDDRDVWDPGAFVGSTHVSEPERAAFRRLLDWGLVDTLRARYDHEGIYTYWDYRDGCFHKKMGMRIDHILASAALAERLRFVLVDRNARKGSKPSDHTVLWAEFDR
ncbi:MAG: exodeoxyribonuclease III [Acidimicrobiales bacterium]